MKILSLVLFLFLSLSANATNVDSFSLAGLDQYKGMNVSLYYVSGRPGGLGTAGQEIHVNKVLLGPQRYSVPSNGVVTVSKSQIPRDGFTSVNFMIIVVHQQAVHALTNSALRSGRIQREPVRYLDDNFRVEYSELNQGFVYKGFKPISQVLSGGYIDL